MNIGAIGSQVPAAAGNYSQPQPQPQKEEAPVPQDSLCLESKSSSTAPAGGGKYANYSADVRQLVNQVASTSGCEVDKIVVVAGGQGDDNITVKRNPDWSYKVTVNDQSTDYDQSQFRNLIIDGGPGNDTITIDKDITGKTYITGGQGDDKIFGGSGSDIIIDNYGRNLIKGNGDNDMIIAGGFDLSPQGPVNPHLNSLNAGINGNIIIGGQGNDYIEGSQANDLIVSGSGNDVVYGLGGHDIITTGGGNNYVDAGSGNDLVRAGQGHNILFGGQGDDNLEANAGSSVIVAGSGHDKVKTGQASAKVVLSPNDILDGPAQATRLEAKSVPANVHSGQAINSEAANNTNVPDTHSEKLQQAFSARVNSDLEAIASTPAGQVMLDEFSRLGKEVVINETNSGNSCGHSQGAVMNDDKSHAEGSNSKVNYNRSRVSVNPMEEWGQRPPLVGLYHEMSHSYNAAQGNMDNRLFDAYGEKSGFGGTKGCEFQAMGLPADDVEANPPEITENGLRQFLNLPERDHY